MVLVRLTLRNPENQTEIELLSNLHGTLSKNTILEERNVSGTWGKAFYSMCRCAAV